MSSTSDLTSAAAGPGRAMAAGPARSVGAPVPALVLPAYALDGRSLHWNAARTAVMFDSTMAEYHSDANAVSSSALKSLVRSPAHMRAYLAGHCEETASQRLGSAVHAAVFEPQRFARDYVVWNGDRRGRKWLDFSRMNAGREILSIKELARVEQCAQAVLVAPAVHDDQQTYTVADLIQYGQVERNVYWLDETTGLTCRMRADLMIQHVTLDLKTTDDARAGEFVRQCVRLHYDIQSAFYLRGRRAFDPRLKSAPFLFVAAELADPYGVQVHQADEEAFVAVGDDKVSVALQTLRVCRQMNQYPSYSAPRTTLKIPVWARYPESSLNI